MEKYFESNFALLYWRNETKRNETCCASICDETAEEDKTGRFQDVFPKKVGQADKIISTVLCCVLYEVVMIDC